MEKLLDVYYIRQINAFTEWLSRHSLGEECIFIDLPWNERFIHAGPPSFIFCAPDGLLTALQKNDREDVRNWHDIFRCTEYEIWENKERYAGKMTPLRFGLTEEEKNFALAHVRHTLGEYLKTGKRGSAPVENIPERFQENVSADVALWTRGALRGSSVVENLPLITALEESAVRSCRDRRFKPLTADELDATVIEIALFSDLRIPLLRREIDAPAIYTANGYLLRTGGAKGWGLPAIFNGVTFKGMHEFLCYLLKKKAHVSKNLLTEASVESFTVDNFVESARSPRTALSLYGPVVRSESRTIDVVATRGADFLCRMQEPDGNIPPIIDPLTGRRIQIDWARMAFTSWTLALFGTVSNSLLYVETARKAFMYVMNNIYTHPYLRDEMRCMSLIYAYKLANVLGESVEAKRVHTTILNLLPKLSYEPARYSQIALHLVECRQEDTALFAKAEEFSDTVLRDYEQRVRSGSRMELSRFAELIQKSEVVSEWYISQQLPDGSFPRVAGSRFAYTRGTVKIFEVLCLEPLKNRDSIKRAVNWLSEMQYSEDNSYFVEESIRNEIIGGFRHDYVNQSVWIDAVGHVLLGASRLTTKSNKS
ncbi:MAG: hypothetical protein A3B99_02810 [Candidatus Yanofskybacteria bacterium RIFCSPHIGHO2_02_FULL_44_12b]|nr:MAG: hypothetical protein A3B99_02810 [Candidatus Yanofskybacteria bacterium RIFCSPHIGHO2_02_FULL_44_12b]